MNIAEALIGLGFAPDDFIVQDDGQGAYLKEWLSDKPRPTDADLERGLKIYLEGQKKEAELQEKRDRFKKVKECYLANPEDISRPERIEFSEYFTFADNGLFYPLEEYPLIVAQIQEWTLNGKMK